MMMIELLLLHDFVEVCRGFFYYSFDSFFTAIYNVCFHEITEFVFHFLNDRMTYLHRHLNDADSLIGRRKSVRGNSFTVHTMKILI
jgi:hypothetical protein